MLVSLYTETGQKQGKIRRHHCSALAGNTLYKRGHETETRHSNAGLSIYGMGDATAFVIKGNMLLATHISLA
jgi:hypothetical protein